MIATVHPSTIRGSIQVPVSKSAMQRALAAALIRKGRTVLYNPGHAADDLAALACIRSLGATVDVFPDRFEILSHGVCPTGDVLDCGESGLSIRMFTSLAALSDQPIRIVGKGSLLTRPMRFFEEVLPLLQVRIQLNDGRLPITLQGPMIPRNITVDGSLSSQFLTGLLMAYAAAGASGVTIEVNELKSRPYIDLTLDILKRFGLPVPENDGYQRFHFRQREALFSAQEIQYTVEGDWSGASFWFAAGSDAGTIELTGLDAMSTQADRAISSVVSHQRNKTAADNDLYLIREGRSGAFEFDATDCPDLFPPLVALAAHIKGESVIYGTDRLRHKESDRAIVLQREFGKLGLPIELDGNAMRVVGGTGLQGGVVHATGDHRIAMSLAIAALRANGPVVIEEAESVRKSYPDFWDDLRSVGASVSLSD